MKNDKKGFTLVEIIVVVAILVVIAGIFSVNMIRSLNKNKDEENKNVVTTITSAAEAYVSANPEKVERLYNGYGYVDIEVGELRDEGFLKEDLKDVETGEIIPDDAIVRVRFDVAEAMSFTYPISEEEKNIKAWELIADPLTIEYDSKTTSEIWCKNRQNLYRGLYDSNYVIKNNWNEVNSRLYLVDNSEEGKIFDRDYFTEAKLEATSCNVNPQVAGTYNITYKYVDPDLKTEKTQNRAVYVRTSGNDVLSFTAVINGDKKIILNANRNNVPIEIEEKYKDGSTTTLDSTVGTLKDIGYEINEQEFYTNVSGTRNVTVSATKTNSDGSRPEPQRPEYTVTDSLVEIVVDDPNCTSKGLRSECYYRGEQSGNFLEYYGKLFRIYTGNLGQDRAKIILEDSYTRAPYGQLGECMCTGCCNHGRFAYIALGDSSTGVNKTMDSYLDDFYASLNGGSTLTYLNSQSFPSYYNVQDYSSRTTGNYYNELNRANNIVTGAILRRYYSKKVALLSLREYMEIANCLSEYNCTSSKNYLTTGKQSFWLLDFYGARFGVGAHNKGVNPAEVYDYTVDTSGAISHAGAVKANGSFDPIIQSLDVRPTIELLGARVLRGTGSRRDPYVLKMSK